MAKRTVHDPRRVLKNAFLGYRLKLAMIGCSAFLTAASEAAVLTSLLAAVQAVSNDGAKVYVLDVPTLGTLTLSAGTLLWMCFGLTVFRMLSQAGAAYAGASIAMHYEATQRMRLFEAYLNASWECQSRERGGQIQILMTQHIHQAAKTLYNTGLAVASLISFLFLLFSAFFVDWKCALFAVVIASTLFPILRPLSSWGQRHVASRVAAQSSFVNTVTQMLAMAREMRIFQAYRYFREEVASVAQLATRHGLFQILSGNLVQILHQSLSLLIVLGGLTAIYYFQISQVATLGIVVLLLVRSLSYAQQLQAHYHAFCEGLPHLEEFQLVESEYLKNAVSTCGIPLDRIDSLEMRNVSFAYQSTDKVLEDVSFRVERGEMIGIVGPSGSGKTTLMQLLLRLRDVQGGEYLVNGNPAETFDTTSWFHHMSFVPQESVLFDESLDECIRFHRSEIDDAQVRKAAELAGIHNEITAFPAGYATRAGERGGNLSGGQRQRICIARAVAGNPQVIIFDEPTSALDVHSEATILDTLTRLKGNATVFIIAHRLSTLNVCDKIIVLCDGQIINFKTPNELAINDSYFVEALRLSQFPENHDAIDER